MASIKDVAKLAHVGPATVSRVLNNTGYVSDETREKVEKAIKELDYKPNELARNLFKKRAGIIAVMVPNTMHPFFSTFISYVESELYAKGYNTMVCNTLQDCNAEHDYLDMLDRCIVDGIITDVHNLDIEVYKHIDKPIVALDRYLGKNIPVVSSDHKAGGRMAAEALIKSGCKKVIQFREEEIYEAPFHDRHKEFSRIMEENGVEVYDIQMELNRFSQEYFLEGVKRAFDLGVDFDGIYGGDLPALLCMNECIRRGMKVPEDVKVVAYDGTLVTDMTIPEISVVVQPIADLAKECVRIVTEMIDGKNDHEIHTVLPVSFRSGGTLKK